MRNKPGYREETITVNDVGGTYLSGLSKDDFRIVRDGHEIPISFLAAEANTPASVGILVDTSGSMETKIPETREAVKQFVSALVACDDVFLFAFSAHPYLLQPLTTDHELVIRRLALLHAYGQTALYDATEQGVLFVQKGRHKEKVLVLITDGLDNTSVSTLDQVVTEAKRLGVSIYTVGIGINKVSSRPDFLGRVDVDGVDAGSLGKLSLATGGRSFVVPPESGKHYLSKPLSDILAALPPRYVVGFNSDKGDQPIQIKVRNHEHAVVSIVNGASPSRALVSHAAN